MTASAPDLPHRSGLLARLARNPLAVISITILLLIILAGLFASLLAPFDPNEANIRAVELSPGGEHLLGTDQSGRDIWSRLLFATRFSLAGAALAMLIAAAIGVTGGLIAGYYGKWFDSVSQWIVTMVMSLPAFVVLLAARSVVGSSLWAAMAIFGFLLAPGFFRLTYSVVLGVRNELYVDAARVAGVRDASLIGRHILSVVRAPVIIQAVMILVIAIAVQSGLGFLGLGDPAVPSWGGMLGDAFARIYKSPLMIAWPATVIGITAICLALLGNALRDALEQTASPSRKSKKRRAVAPAAEHIEAIEHADDTPDGNEILSIDELVVGYDRSDGGVTTVVNGVSLTVRSGEVHGLIGESGSGKTQTAFAVMRLLPEGGRIISGSVVFDGIDLASRSDREVGRMRGGRIAYIPQEPMSNLDPVFTIGSQLVEPMRVLLGLSRKAAKVRALELLARVGIPEPERTFRAYPHEISGGMAQRVLIAGAISCDPDLLIADEPTTALDVTIQADVLDLLRSLQRELNLSVVLVTHNFGVVADICDRVSVMKDGRIVESGPVASVFADPCHDYTKSLFAALLDDPEPRGDLIAAPPSGGAK